MSSTSFSPVQLLLSEDSTNWDLYETICNQGSTLEDAVQSGALIVIDKSDLLEETVIQVKTRSGKVSFLYYADTGIYRMRIEALEEEEIHLYSYEEVRRAYNLYVCYSSGELDASQWPYIY